METLTLLVDCVAMVLIAYYSLRNERREEGTPEAGPFRIKPPPKPPGPPAPITTRRRRLGF